MTQIWSPSRSLRNKTSNNIGGLASSALQSNLLLCCNYPISDKSCTSYCKYITTRDLPKFRDGNRKKREATSRDQQESPVVYCTYVYFTSALLCISLFTDQTTKHRGNWCAKSGRVWSAKYDTSTWTWTSKEWYMKYRMKRVSAWVERNKLRRGCEISFFFLLPASSFYCSFSHKINFLLYFGINSRLLVVLSFIYSLFQAKSHPKVS